MHPPPSTAADAARFIRDQLPPGGLFADQHWRIAPEPFPLEPDLARELASLGRVLLQFYRAVNLLYRQSVAGKQPAWVADWLDRGKPADLIALQRDPAFKHDLPRVIRPDLLLTGAGLTVTELDSVPGGLGLTAWLNQTYAELGARTQARGAKAPADSLSSASHESRDRTGPIARTVPGEPALDLPLRGALAGSAGTPRPTGSVAGEQVRMEEGALHAPSSILHPPSSSAVLGGARGMIDGFASLFGDAPRVHVVVSEEAATYRPEMAWLCEQLGSPRFQVQDARFEAVADGDAVYRFFELFDLANVPAARTLFQRARARRIRLTPPPKPVFEEKLLFALLWNWNLRGFWRQELGEAFFQRLLERVPYSWIIDPTPLPPNAAIPELNLTDWRQLQTLSQRERELILKVSGFSAQAWGARGVHLGSDLSSADWSAAVDRAIASAGTSPHILQRYLKPRLVEARYYDFERDALVPMPGRARLCPYYFVVGEGDAARPHLGGVLATICPADKKIIHGMKDAILAPCVAPGESGNR